MSMFTPAAIGQAGMVLQGFGALNSAIGSYYAAESAKNQLRSQQLTYEFQSKMGAINARLVEAQAQQILRAGQQRMMQRGLAAGQVISASRASMAARGIVLNEGNPREIEATTMLMKEIDLNTINANTVRAAAAERMRKVGIEAKSMLDATSAENVGLMAGAINPFMAAGTSLLGSAGNLASSWYSDYNMKQFAATRATT